MCSLFKAWRIRHVLALYPVPFLSFRSPLYTISSLILIVVLTGVSRFLQVKLDEKKKKDAAPAEEGKDVKGIPEFWLTTFKNVEMVQEMILEHDEPILEKLTDVTVSFSEKPMVI